MPDGGGGGSNPPVGHDVTPLEKYANGNVEVDAPGRHWPGAIPHTGPTHPHYSSYQARLNSFKEWPPGLKQTKEMMAEAGLWYFGSSDYVKCFYCDGGLKEWNENDDPWVEHAGWFSQCGFVRLVRGDKFVQESQAEVRRIVQTRREQMGIKTENDVIPAISRLSVQNSFDSTMSEEELIKENQEMKEQRQCKVCMDCEVEVVFLPCAHLVSCAKCATGLSKCAVCRTPILETVRVYMA